MGKDGGEGRGGDRRGRRDDGWPRVGAPSMGLFAVLQNGPVSVCRTRLTGLPAISVRMEST